MDILQRLPPTFGPLGNEKNIVEKYEFVNKIYRKYI
jgi:hypothetical protein